MEIGDFDFVNLQQESNVVKRREKFPAKGRSKPGPPLAAPGNSPLIVNDGDRYLRIVRQTSQIASHRELFELLQSEDIQRFLPHQVLISAWGDFDGPHLQHDVVSALPGLRTGLLDCCAIDGLLQGLYKRWLFCGRKPLLLDSTTDATLAHSACDCALHKFLQGAWSFLVHGIIDVRDGNVSLYLTLYAGSNGSGQNIERFRGLVDPLITQIDVAFRRIAVLESPGSVNPECRSAPSVLSAREEEVLRAVSEGKTNTEISNNLAISVHTVKNHLRRIMQKLNAANRTDAAAKHRQLNAAPQRIHGTRKSSYDLMMPPNA
jgi:transcriptional regulator EpsA